MAARGRVALWRRTVRVARRFACARGAMASRADGVARRAAYSEAMPSRDQRSFVHRKPWPRSALSTNGATSARGHGTRQRPSGRLRRRTSVAPLHADHAHGPVRHCQSEHRTRAVSPDGYVVPAGSLVSVGGHRSCRFPPTLSSQAQNSGEEWQAAQSSGEPLPVSMVLISAPRE